MTNTSSNIIVGDANLINNTFTNINNTNYIIHTLIYSEYDYGYILSNNSKTHNKFINNSATDTIQYIITYDSITAGLTPEEVLEQNNISTENNIYQNTTINDTLTLNIPNKIYTGEPITITGTYKLNNPSFYDSNILEQNKFNIYINGVLNQTVDELEFTVTPTVGTMMVTVQPTISQTRKTTAIRVTTLSNIVITPENYNEYIYEGVLVGVGKDSKITFNGTFTNKEEIVLDTNDILIDGTNATFTNTIFILDAENITLQNMKINNTNTDYPIKNFKDNNIIINNTINLNNTNGKTAAIYNTASNTIISNNIIKVDGPAGDIDYETGSGICTTQAILLIGGDNNTIEYNNINITSSQAGTTFGTIEGNTNSKNVTNTLIQYNTLNVSGGRFNYGINSLNNVKNITIAYNNITVTSERYTDGIQIGDGATDNLITNNNINLTCLNTTPVDEAAISYGVIITSQGGQISNNNTITQNNININGMVNYGMEIYSSTNTQITQNNITLNGAKSMGIGYDHSHNSTVTENKITINDDSTQPLNGITEEIQPLSTGIKVIDSENIVIENNSIKTNDKAKTDTTIDTESTNTTIKNNQLISSKGYGVDTIKTTQTDTTIENNTIKTITTFTVDKVAITNTNITLTATVNDEFENNINGGTISFTNGNEVIAQAEVIDGVATATVIFTEVQNTTIIASYTPASNRFATSSNKTTISIQEAQTILNMEEINLTAGETVNLTATVTDQTGNYINGGKVTFKVNGKTIKDENGKVIYAKVVDGVATAQYTVPENLGGQDINITAVYSGTNKYNKETTTITTTVTAPEAKLTITPITS
ncbi:MAG: Ig-like domain repeat protein, partial [Methanosphaera sp.]|nr:Ig-like domain repeat protein [Methanosphaera sp.]